MQHRVELTGVGLETYSGALDLQVVYSTQGAQTVGRSGELGRDGRTGEMPHVGEGAGLNRPAEADDRHPVTERFHLGEDVAGEENRTPTCALLVDALLEDLFHQRV